MPLKNSFWSHCESFAGLVEGFRVNAAMRSFASPWPGHGFSYHRHPADMPPRRRRYKNTGIGRPRRSGGVEKMLIASSLSLLAMTIAVF